MEGNPAATDYAAILADMEAKYAALGNAIASLRAALATGALGVGEISTGPSSAGITQPPGAPVSLPRGAFLGKSVTEAIKLYLSAIRKKQTNKEIAQALKDGGLESTGNFDSYVTGGLFRLKNEGTLLRFDDGWGLAEWYPESFRTRVVEKAGNGEKRRGKKKAARKNKAAEGKATPKAVSAAPVEGLEHRIEKMLRAEPARVFSPQEIAKALDAKIGVVILSLGRMAGKQKASKSEHGYEMFGGNVQEISQVASKVS
jgi:hypothetical protein